MIYVRTCAYNAEKTLRRAMDSVLNQTYGEFTYYVLDNGSTDKTGDIIREYAEKDTRVVPFFNKINHKDDENPEFWLLTQKLQEDDLFCVLDADDAYDLTFLQEMIPFLQDNHLDMAACGTRFIDASNNMLYGENRLKHNRILVTPNSYNQYFAEVHWNLRQVWGKVYTARAAQARYEIQMPEWFPKAYGGDTVNVYECVKAGNAIGVYAKTLHSYYMSPKSVSHKWIEGREDADEVLFDKAIELLKVKCGFISENNLQFLHVVYYNALKDTFEVLFSADLQSDKKLSLVKKIMNKKLTINMVKELPAKINREFLESIAVNIIKIVETANISGLNDCYQILATLTADFVSLIPRETFQIYVQQCPKVVEDVALEKYRQAIPKIKLVVTELEKDDDISNIELWLKLGMDLTALCNVESEYVFFSKKMIIWKWENKKKDEAIEELKEWLSILPDDFELLQIKEKMTESFKSKEMENFL